MRLVRFLVFCLCLVPIAWLAFRFFTHRLSANPIDDITDATGTWTLRFLLITLAVTPIRRTVWNDAIRLRRMLGLFAFFYGTLHMMTYVWLDQFFAWGDIAKDIGKRPFITAGMTGFVLMIPLALTSTRKSIARLGKKWVTLHRLIYVSAIAGVVHYYWLVKADIRRPLIYGVLLFGLFAVRFIRSKRAKLL
jgi:methionine sulfoxide reductase heme-binding subunit